MKLKLSRALSASLLSVAVLAACGGEEKKPATQVAAKVNDGEISVHQINFLLQRLNNVPADKVKAASAQVLDRLIEQELLVQKAAEQKLDRDPRVLQAIEAAKRDVLSRAYLEKIAADVARPSEQEIKDYYNAHPELFGERRIYQYAVIAVLDAAKLADQIKAEAAKASSLKDLLPWLRTQSVRAAYDTKALPAERIPEEPRKRLAKMKDGQIDVFVTPRGGVEIVHLLASKTDPVDEAKAKPAIEQFLLTQRRAERARTEVAGLRAAAKIEKLGDFAQAPETTPDATGGAPANPLGTPEAAVPEVPSDAPQAQEAPPAVESRESIERGVTGLK